MFQKYKIFLHSLNVAERKDKKIEKYEFMY